MESYGAKIYCSRLFANSERVVDDQESVPILNGMQNSLSHLRNELPLVVIIYLLLHCTQQVK